jgi:hypothetical protein
VPLPKHIPEQDPNADFDEQARHFHTILFHWLRGRELTL